MIDRDDVDGKTRITVERKIQKTFLGPAASPATRELDDLMASLSETRVSGYTTQAINNLRRCQKCRVAVGGHFDEESW